MWTLELNSFDIQMIRPAGPSHGTARENLLSSLEEVRTRVSRYSETDTQNKIHQ